VVTVFWVVGSVVAWYLVLKELRNSVRSEHYTGESRIGRSFR